MNQQKLYIVIGSLMVGGTETFLVRYLSFLAKQGWEIEVFTLAYDPGVLADSLKQKGITLTPLLNNQDKLRLSRYPIWLERIIRIKLCISRLSTHLRSKTDGILHLFLPEAYVLGMIAALLARFKGPKIMSRRSLNYYQAKRPVVAWLEKRIHPCMDVIIGNSNPVIKQLQEEGIPAEKLRLIYNGLDVNDLERKMQSIYPENCDKIKENLKLEPEDLVFIIVANLIPYKGHRDLLQAFHLIKHKLSQPWKLLCVGRDQGIAENLIRLAEEYYIQDNVLWLGERNDVPALLQIADIGILCSHEEGFSNAVLEAMAAGLPMVVTNVGGNAEAVLTEETGYVVAPKNPEALSQALLQLAENKQKRQVFGENAKQRVLKHFTLDQCVEQHIAVYKELNK